MDAIGTRFDDSALTSSMAFRATARAMGGISGATAAAMTGMRYSGPWKCRLGGKPGRMGNVWLVGTKTSFSSDVVAVAAPQAQAAPGIDDLDVRGRQKRQEDLRTGFGHARLIAVHHHRRDA